MPKDTKPVQEDEDLDDDDEENTTSDDDDDDDEDDESTDKNKDHDDDDEDEDENTHKGVGGDSEVAVVDGEAILAACREGAAEGAYQAGMDSREELVKAILGDDELLDKIRGIVGGQVKESFAKREDKFNTIAERMDKAVGNIETLSKSLFGTATLIKGVQNAEDEAAKTTPAYRTVSEEIVRKGLGVEVPAAPADDLAALMAEAKSLQIEKGIASEVLTTIMSDVLYRRSPEALTALKTDIARLKAV